MTIIRIRKNGEWTAKKYCFCRCVVIDIGMDCCRSTLAHSHRCAHPLGIEWPFNGQGTGFLLQMGCWQRNRMPKPATQWFTVAATISLNGNLSAVSLTNKCTRAFDRSSGVSGHECCSAVAPINMFGPENGFDRSDSNRFSMWKQKKNTVCCSSRR